MKKFKALCRYNRWVAAAGLRIAKLQYRFGAKEDALQTASHTAGYCALNYTGRYFWPQLERFLHEVAGRELPSQPPAAPEGVLHIITTAYATGGHTRYLARWIEADTSIRDLVLLHQTEPIPAVLEALRMSRPDLRLIQLDAGMPILQRAAALRRMAAGFKAVVLHQHANDVVPVLAFAQAEGPSVGYLNHGDHTFWLGASVTDLLIQFRSSMAERDAARRGITRFSVLPVPLLPPPDGRAEAIRKGRHLPDGAVILLTVSAPYKFTPNERHHFFRTAAEVLRQHPGIHWLVAGPASDHPAAEGFLHERLHLLGPQAGTDDLEAACDLYVDSFPFSSPTSAMQLAARGKPVLLMYAPEQSNIVFEQGSALRYPSTLEAWMRELGRLISEPDYRLKVGRAQQEYVRLHHDVTAGWLDQAEAVSASLCPLKHSICLPDDTPLVITKEEQFIYGQIANNIRLSGIVITRNPLLRIASHVLSAVFVICRLMLTGRTARK